MPPSSSRSRVAVGYDIRLSSPQLAAALKRGLKDCGTNVLDIGLWGTEGSYFATFAEQLDGGIMVTASHNPPDYNGMKFVREEARPISADTGLQEMRRLIETGQLPAKAARPGTEEPLDIHAKYLQHLLGYVDLKKLQEAQGRDQRRQWRRRPHRGCRSSRTCRSSSSRSTTIPTAHFPHGVPNPMLEENQAATADIVRRNGADVGIAWDGDYDRCFFFDETGQFIDGYYLVGLLAEHFLALEPGARIVHDPRLTWNTLDIVRRHGGTAGAVQVRPRLHQGRRCARWTPPTAGR